MAEEKKSAARTLDTQDLLRRLNAQKTDRSGSESAWDQVEKFICPHGDGRLPTVDTESNVEWERQGIWDLTAPEAHQKISANLHGSITSSAIRWYHFTPRSKAKIYDLNAQAAADEIADRSYDALQESKFNTEISCVYQSASGFGDAYMMAEVKDEFVWRGLDIRAIPLRDGYFEADEDDRIVTWWEVKHWTPVQLREKFGEESLSDRVRDLLKKPDCGVNRLDVVFCIAQRPDAYEKYESRKKWQVLARDKRPFGSCYFMADSGEPVGQEGGYYEMPVFHLRWQKTAGSRWGFGLGHLALPTVKSVNAFVELLLLKGQEAVDPMTLVREDALASDVLSYGPGKAIVCRDPQTDVKVLESSANFNVAAELIREMQNAIRHVFHEDDLQLKDSPAMTATEVQVRYELMNRVLGSTLARIQSDLLSPLLKLVVSLMYRSGQLPNVPAALLERGELSIEYQGPLARAQRTDEVAAIERGAAFVAGLLKLGFDEVRDAFDPTEAVREAFKRLGVPAKVLPSEATVARKRKAREALMARAANAETSRAEGEAVEQRANAVRAAQQAASTPVPATPTPLVAPVLPGA